MVSPNTNSHPTSSGQQSVRMFRVKSMQGNSQEPSSMVAIGLKFSASFPKASTSIVHPGTSVSQAGVVTNTVSETRESTLT